MKIYTKTGDNGTTGLYDGSRVTKTDQILDALGTLDELSAHIGKLLFLLKKFYITEASDKYKIIPFLISLQTRLLNVGSIIATPNPGPNTKLPTITLEHVSEIENLIDNLDSELKPLTVFIVQEGRNEKEVEAHICRTITRRAEREINKYGSVSEEILKFMNRLSDFFFTFARYVSEPHIQSKKIKPFDFVHWFSSLKKSDIVRSKFHESVEDMAKNKDLELFCYKTYFSRKLDFYSWNESRDKNGRHFIEFCLPRSWVDICTNFKVSHPSVELGLNIFGKTYPINEKTIIIPCCGLYTPMNIRLFFQTESDALEEITVDYDCYVLKEDVRRNLMKQRILMDEVMYYDGVATFAKED